MKLKKINIIVALVTSQMALAQADTIIDAPADLIQDVTAYNYRIGLVSGSPVIGSAYEKNGERPSFGYTYPSKATQLQYDYEYAPMLNKFFDNNNLGIASQQNLISTVEDVQIAAYRTLNELQFISSAVETVQTALSVTDIDDSALDLVADAYGDGEIYSRIVVGASNNLGFEEGVDIRNLDANKVNLTGLTQTLGDEARYFVGEAVDAVTGSGLPIPSLPEPNLPSDLTGLTDALAAPQALITEALTTLPAGDLLGGLGDTPELPSDLTGLTDALATPQALITEALTTLPTGDLLGGLGDTPELPSDLTGLTDALATPQALITEALTTLPTGDLLGGLGNTPELPSDLTGLTDALAANDLLGALPDALGSLPTGDLLGGGLGESPALLSGLDDLSGITSGLSNLLGNQAGGTPETPSAPAMPDTGPAPINDSTSIVPPMVVPTRS